MRLSMPAGLLAGLVLALPTAAQDLVLGAPFQDHMVVQHDAPLVLWGRTAPGRDLSCSWQRASGELASEGHLDGTVEADGAWSVRLEAPGLSEDPLDPLTITVSDGVESVTLTDVLAGEVWLASGQSNMEWPVHDTSSAESLPARGRVEGLRMFTAERRSLPEPADEVVGSWRVMDPGTVGDFSAVAAHFGLDLLAALDRPVGIVHTSWGGSSVQAWSGPGTLDGTAAGRASLEAWTTGRAMSVRERASWSGTALAGDDAEGWAPCDLPLFFDALGEMQGAYWFRREVSLPEGGADPAFLSLGAIDEYDEVWVDGVPVGSGSDWTAERRYELPSEARAALAAGPAVIAIRAENVYGLGGFSSAPELLHIELDDGARIPIADGWTWRVGAPVPDLPSQRRPCQLSNGMLVGLERLPLRGFIWYQGEANAADPAGYADMFPAMIRGWRSRFPARTDGPLPFYFVQLASYLPPGHEDWPGLREAQRRSMELPATGMAVTIDVGNPSDIHPRDKASVGERLARWALARTYALDVVPSGPLPDEATMTEGSLAVAFETFGSPLATRSGGELVAGLEVVSADGSSHPVPGRIDGDRVLLDLAALPEGAARPTQVRYAWADDPVSSNLVNRLGLPASPFQVPIRRAR